MADKMTEQQLGYDIKELTKSGDFHKLERALNAFCPFKALGVESQENPNSDFIREVITPHGPHGFGDACFGVFIDCLLASLSDADRGRVEKQWGDLKAWDFSRVAIHREYICKKVATRARMDLVIEFANAKRKTDLVFIIEVKLGGGEYGAQLSGYEEFVPLFLSA